MLSFPTSQEDVGDKIDRLNEEINQFIHNFNENRTLTSKLSRMSSFQCSYLESSENLGTENDEISAENYIPQEFLDKFEESLVEIDRLKMKIEDFLSQKTRSEISKVKFLLDFNQIKALYGFLNDKIASFTENTVFALDHDSLQIGDYKIIKSDHIQKLSSLEIENINLRTQLLSQTVKPPQSSQKTLNQALDTFNLELELEKRILAYSRKEQSLQTFEEEYGCKLIQLELLINEYNSKQENSAPSKPLHGGHRAKHPSCDFTRKHTPSFLPTQLSQTFVDDILMTRVEIESKLANIEKYIKSQYLKKKVIRDNTQTVDNVYDQFGKNENLLGKKLETMLPVSQKEKTIFEYLKEQRGLLAEGLEALKKHEEFLIDTWGSIGKEDVMELKNIVAIYYRRNQELRKERENIDLRRLRVSKLFETVNEEFFRLREHRKKINIERQKLQIATADIEKHLYSIASITKKR